MIYRKLLVGCLVFSMVCGFSLEVLAQNKKSEKKKDIEFIYNSRRDQTTIKYPNGDRIRVSGKWDKDDLDYLERKLGRDLKKLDRGMERMSKRLSRDLSRLDNLDIKLSDIKVDLSGLDESLRNLDKDIAISVESAMSGLEQSLSVLEDLDLNIDLRGMEDLDLQLNDDFDFNFDFDFDQNFDFDFSNAFFENLKWHLIDEMDYHINWDGRREFYFNPVKKRRDPWKEYERRKGLKRVPLNDREKRKSEKKKIGGK